MARKRGRPVNGWFVFDKPLEMTSTQAVGVARRRFDAQKAGHAGTLDPLATGILPIALGEATKTVAWLMEADKEYRFAIRWGASTDTQDAEGRVIATSDVRPSRAALEQALAARIGTLDQVPPQFSAIKVDGERAYDLAREGEVVELAPRQVTLHEGRIADHSDAETLIEIRCSKGYYVRALVRDLALDVGAEGHVCLLRRTRVGPFAEAHARGLDILDQMVHEGRASEALLPIETALDDIPALAINEDEAFKLRQGRSIVLLPHQVEGLRALRRPRTVSGEDMSCAALARFRDTAIALGDVRAGKFSPIRLFHLDP